MVDKHRGNPKWKRTAAEAASRAAEMTNKAAAVAEREETRARFAEEVAHVGSAVARELALPRILDVILDETVLTLGAQIRTGLLDRQASTRARTGRTPESPGPFREKLSRVSLDDPLLAARAASTRDAQLVSSIDEIDPALELTSELMSRMGCESIVALPLVVRDRLLGVLVFAMEASHAFTLQERVALDSCASIFSFGIANATAYEHEHRLHLLFEAVGNATLAIASEFELRPVLQNIVDEARRIAGAEYGALWLFVAEEGALWPVVFSGITKEQESAIGRHPVTMGTFGVPAFDGQAVRMADVRPHPAFGWRPDQYPTVTSLLVVPVRHKGRSMGNLYLANKLGAPEFTVEDERAVGLLASHAGARFARVNCGINWTGSEQV